MTFFAFIETLANPGEVQIMTENIAGQIALIGILENMADLIVGFMTHVTFGFDQNIHCIDSCNLFQNKWSHTQISTSKEEH